VASARPPAPLPPAAASRTKRSFKEQRELDALPAAIDALETEIAALHATMAGPDYYRQPGDVLAGDRARLAELEARLAAAFARWETLEAAGG
jgi:ATP-binding cassette subfamily F protein uup